MHALALGKNVVLTNFEHKHFTLFSALYIYLYKIHALGGEAAFPSAGCYYYYCCYYYYYYI